MAKPTWSEREVPILEAIGERATSVGGPRWEEVVDATGLPEDKVQLSLRRLYDAGWIDGTDVSGMGGGFELLEIRLMEPALRAVGIWPADPYAELVSVLELQIANEPDAARRGRLEQLLNAAMQVGQGVATAILTDVVKRTTGV